MNSKTPDKLEANLKLIRLTLDTKTEGVDIDTVQEVGKRLASLMGLSAECMASARRRMEVARLKAFKELEGRGYSPSVMLKMAEANISMESATYEYADRLNAAITHQIDYFRTLISLYKSEMENSLK